MRQLGAILTRELNAFFRSAMAPVVLTGFLLLTGFAFTSIMLAYSELSLSALKSGKAIQEALNLSDGVFQPLVSAMAVFLIFLLPAVTMRLFSEEYRSGRHDLLMTYPVDEHIWVLGKFLGSVVVGLVMVACAGLFFGVAAWLGHPEVGPLIAALTGLLMAVLLMSAWGVFFSTLFQYQVVSYILTFAFVMILYTIGDLEPYLPDALAGLSERLSLGLHLNRFTMGVIDSRDVVYVLSLTALGLFCATASLAGRRMAGGMRLARWVPVALLAVLLIVLDIIAAGSPLQADLTRNKRNSLAPQTLQILETLPEDVRVTAFYQRLDPRRKAVETMLAAFGNHCGRFSYRIVNPDLEPALVGEMGITTARAVVIESGDRKRTILDPDEGILINTIFRVVEGRQPVVSFLQGHGERRLDHDDRQGYTMFSQVLRDQGYVPHNLLLLETGAVPSNTDVLVIAQPQTEISMDELAAVQLFIDQGGAVLVLIDPGAPENLDRWLGNFNIKPGNDFLFSKSGVARSFGVDERVMVLFEYGPHEITRGLDGMATFFPLAQTLQPLNADLPGVELMTILLSDDTSWGETDLEALSKGIAAFDETVDRRGPQAFGVAAEIDLKAYLGNWMTSSVGGDREADASSGNVFLDRLRQRAGTAALPASVFSQGDTARLVVVGDADFAANASINLYGNRDLLLNMISWLAQEKTLIATRALDTVSEPIVLTVDQKRWLGWICTLIWPLLVCCVSVVVIARRRRRG